MTAIFAWLAMWWPTILICIALAAFVGFLIFGLVRDKKKGKSCCGGCSGCAMSGACCACERPTADESIDDSRA